MNEAAILQSFLVTLGFKVDDGGQKKLEGALKSGSSASEGLSKAIGGAAKNVTKAGAAIAGAAVAIFAGVVKIATGLDKLYFASKRIGDSAVNIQAFTFALTKMGVSSEEAAASLENIAKFMATNPGGEGIIHSIGIQTRDANDQLRGTTDILADLGDKFKNMPTWMAAKWAESFGIDYKTMLAMREGTGKFSDEYKAMAKAIGFNSEQATEASHKFKVGLDTLKATAELMFLKVGSGIAGMLAPQLEKLENWIKAHMPQIRKALDKVTEGFVMLIDAGARIGKLILSMVEGFTNMSGASQMLVVALAAVAAAFLPVIGPLLIASAAIAGFLLLLDDFTVWKNGGKSFYNWGAPLDFLEEKFKKIENLVAHIRAALHDIPEILDDISKGDFSAAWKLLNTDSESQRQAAAERIKALAAKDKPLDSATASMFADDEKKYKVPAGFLERFFTVESGRNPKAINPASGAKGGFQFMDPTAAQYGVKDPYDLTQSAEGASKYIAHLIEHFSGNLVKVAAAYNWGEGNVDRQGLINAPKETQEYIHRIFGPDYNPRTGELTTPLANSSDSQSSTTVSNTFNIYGATDPQKTAEVVHQHIDNSSKRQARVTQQRVY